MYWISIDRKNGEADIGQFYLLLARSLMTRSLIIIDDGDGVCTQASTPDSSMIRKHSTTWTRESHTKMPLDAWKDYTMSEDLSASTSREVIDSSRIL